VFSTTGAAILPVMPQQCPIQCQQALWPCVGLIEFSQAKQQNYVRNMQHVCTAIQQCNWPNKIGKTAPVKTGLVALLS